MLSRAWSAAFFPPQPVNRTRERATVKRRSVFVFLIAGHPFVCGYRGRKLKLNCSTAEYLKIFDFSVSLIENIETPC